MPVHPADVEIFKWVSDNVDLLVGMDLMSGNPQSQQDSASGDHKCLMTVSPAVLVIFQYGPKWWTEIVIHAVMPPVWLKIRRQ